MLRRVYKSGKKVFFRGFSNRHGTESNKYNPAIFGPDILYFSGDLEEAEYCFHTDVSLHQNDRPRKKDSVDPYRHLWVYEAEDVSELSVTELLTVWDHRDQLCGSNEAAAETLAVLEVFYGIVDQYKGWETYLEDERLHDLSLNIFSLGVKKEEGWNESEGYGGDYGEEDEWGIDVETVSNMELYELKEAWKIRQKVFSSIKSASEALSRIRFLSGIDEEKKPWSSLLEHTEIKALYGLIPDSDHESYVNGEAHEMMKRSFSILSLDKREKQKGVAYRRDGQSTFRDLVLNNYYHTCCVTGCTEVRVLEAAHILPYMGEHTNIIENSLCLRVDVHRLFDGFLLAINPEGHEVVVSRKLFDQTYRSISGKKIILGKVRPSKSFLLEHYSKFVSKESGF